MDQTAIRFARWSWIAGSWLLVARCGGAGPAAGRAAGRPRSAIAAAGCTGCFTTRRTRSRTSSSVIPRPSSSRRSAITSTEQFAVQVSKADPHRFTLYHTDFLPGTNAFSPIGASRFNIMSTRMPGWPGPIIVEWTPEQPELAESRRQAIVDDAEQGRPADAWPSASSIGPSPYPGAMGVEAANNYHQHDHAQPDVGAGDSRCRRPSRPRWESADMMSSTDRRIAEPADRVKSEPLAIGCRSCSAACWRRRSCCRGGLRVPRRGEPMRRAGTPPAHDVPPAARQRPIRPRRSPTRTNRRSTRRRPSVSSSRFTSTSARSSRPRATSTRRSRSTRTPSRSSRPRGAGRSGRPTRPWPIAGSASASIGSGGSPRPRRTIKKALKLSPKDPKIWNDAGYSYYLQGRWTDAERALQDGRRSSPRTTSGSAPTWA